MKFESVTTDPGLSEGDIVVLNCHVRPNGNIKTNVTVELTDNQGRNLTSEFYSLVNRSASVQYNVNLTSSPSRPFHCKVTASVGSTETVSKTFEKHVHVLGESFEHII